MKRLNGAGVFMENEILFQICEEFFKNKNIVPRKWNFFALQYNSFINQKKLRNAKREYAHYNPEMEKPILLVDDTIINSGKRGFVLTNVSLYYRVGRINSNSDIKNNIPLYKLNDIYISLFKQGSYLVVNGINIGVISSFNRGGFGEKEARVVNELFVQIMLALHPTKKAEDFNHEIYVESPFSFNFKNFLEIGYSYFKGFLLALGIPITIILAIVLLFTLLSRIFA